MSYEEAFQSLKILVDGLESGEYPLEDPARLTGEERKELLDRFALLDDNDIIASAKVWSQEKDAVLADLCDRLVNRRLFHVEIQNHPFSEEKVWEIRKRMMKDTGLSEEDTASFVFTNTISNFAYSPSGHQIRILRKDGSVKDITEVSEIMDEQIISRIVEKHIFCYPKEYLSDQ